MMYRREAPKPVREPGSILLLIGCGCMYRGRFFNSGSSTRRMLHNLQESIELEIIFGLCDYYGVTPMELVR
jgi:hypothetical protein